MPSAGCEAKLALAKRKSSGPFSFELRLPPDSAQTLQGPSRAPDVVGPDGAQLFWAGRLYETAGLCRQLGLPAGTADSLIAATLLERAGPAALGHLVGCWSLAWLPRLGECLLARDAMGGLGLFWVSVPGGILVSTEWQSLFADARWERRHDEDTLAAFFSLYLSPTDGSSFYRELQLVAPGSWVQPTAASVNMRHYWQPLAAPAWRGSPSDAEAAYRQHLLVALQAAVADASAPALLLSSGLDSSGIAAMASAHGMPLRGLSWSVPSVAEVDESRWIAESARDLCSDWELTPADGLWPLHQVEAYQPPILGPLSPALGALRQCLYRRAEALGTDVVLTGDGGDLLFMGAEGWLLSLLAAGRWSAAAAGFRAEWQAGRAGECLANQARCLLPAPIKALRTLPPPPWLTAEAVARLRSRLPTLRGTGAARRLRAIQSGWTDLYELALAPGFADMGLVVRHPYRDQRLVEWLLRLPAHLLYRPGESKRLARRALRGLLPDSIRMAPRRGTLLPLAQRFLTDSLPSVRAILGTARCDWQRWVRRDWMEASLEELPRLGRDGAGWLVVWNCVVYELWKQRWTNNGCGTG